MRPPAVAGRFYPSDPESLREELSLCLADRPPRGMQERSERPRRIAGAMVPHAGYMASGTMAGHAFGRMENDGHPDAYVIIGPDHHGMSRENTLCSEDFLTPLGPCPVHTDIARRLSRLIPDRPSAHAFEHSIEVEVPFLQYIDPEAEIVPVMMSDQSPQAAERLASALKEACEGYDVVLIASTDMSHYIPKKEAERLDGMVLEKIAAMDWEGMYRTVARNSISMCGYGPTATVMIACEGCSPEMLGHMDSYDSLRVDEDSVVGYGSALFLKP